MENIVLKNKIREHRARLRMSQEELAKLIGVDRMTIGNHEAGRTTPDMISGLLMARAFGCAIEQIFEINQI